MALEVMLADMGKVDGLRDLRARRKIRQVTRERGVVGNAGPIDLEVCHVNRIEPQQGRKQFEVNFGQTIASEELAGFKQVLHRVEGLKDGSDRITVSGLAGGKACTVDAVANGVLDQIGQTVDFGVQVQKELYEFPDWPLPESAPNFTPGPVMQQYPTAPSRAGSTCDATLTR